MGSKNPIDPNTNLFRDIFATDKYFSTNIGMLKLQPLLSKRLIIDSSHHFCAIHTKLSRTILKSYLDFVSVTPKC